MNEKNDWLKADYHKPVDNLQNLKTDFPLLFSWIDLAVIGAYCFWLLESYEAILKKIFQNCGMVWQRLAVFKNLSAPLDGTFLLICYFYNLVKSTIYILYSRLILRRFRVDTNAYMLFCYQNCSDLLWDKIVLEIEKTFEI